MRQPRIPHLPQHRLNRTAREMKMESLNATISPVETHRHTHTHTQSPALINVRNTGDKRVINNGWQTSDDPSRVEHNQTGDNDSVAIAYIQFQSE